MARQTVTGPILIYVRFYGDNDWNFLGTSEVAPILEHLPEWVPSMNDLAGPLKAFDRMFAGEESIFATKLNYYNYSIYMRMTARPHMALGSEKGNMPFGAIGSLEMENKKYFELAIKSSFYGTANAGFNLESGYWFPMATVDGEKHDPLGMKPRAINMTVFCKMKYDPETLGWRVYYPTIDELVLPDPD